MNLVGDRPYLLIAHSGWRQGGLRLRRDRQGVSVAILIPFVIEVSEEM